MKTVLNGSKRVLAVLLALLMLSSAFAVVSFAANDFEIEAKDVSTSNSVLTLVVSGLPEGYSVSTSDITIKNSTKTLVPGDDYSILKKSATEFSITFQSLNVGDKYTFTVIARDASSNTKTAAEEINIKNTKAAPVTLETIAKEKNSLTVTYYDGAEYACVKNGDTAAPVYQSSNKFTGLEAGTFYDIYARYKETSTTYASDAKKISAKTLTESAGIVPPAPVIENVTMSSITVVDTDGYEYSIDSGKTWNSSNEFKSLKASTTYFVIQRLKVDDTISEQNPSSPSTTVTTNSATANITTFSQVKAPVFKNASEIYVDKDNTVIAYALTRTSGENQWGDIQYIPTKCQVMKDNTVRSETYFVKQSDGTYAASFKPTEESSVYVLRVVYSKQRWEGSKFNVLDSTSNYKDLKFESKVEPQWWQTMLNKVLDFLVNQLPKYIIMGIEYLRKNANQ